MTAPYTIVIGLEVHVQLATQTKLFCRCLNKFGAEPNVQTCPVCLGLPGSLPVMNRHAFELSLKTALALDCQINRFTKWDRKQYYYPDLPKGYQISQYDLPFSYQGRLEISDPKGRFPTKDIRILRAHLEEDAGKSMHDEVSGKQSSRIDLNRTGTPLLEIVSEPDMRSPAEAKAYLTELKLLLMYLGVSDCNMQEGSLRVDANINLHIPTPQGVVATPIVEVKNVNSFRAVEKAMEYEAARQYTAWQADGLKLGDVPKQTRGWDDVAFVTRGQRQKEESSDYRYFPDPDLAPVRVSEEQLTQIQAELGERPAAIRARFQTEYGLSADDSEVLVNQGLPLVNYFEAVAKGCGDGRVASNWMRQDVLRWLNEQNTTIENYPVSATALCELLQVVRSGKLTTSRGRELLVQMIASGSSVATLMQEQGIAEVDESSLFDLCRELLAANPKVLADLQAGKMQAAGSLIGMAKKRNPNVNPARFREVLLEVALPPSG